MGGGDCGLMTALKCVAVIGLLAWGLPGGAAAQAVGGGALLQAYTFENPDAAGLETIHLLTVPFAVTVPIAGRLGVSVSGAYASGIARGAEGVEATLSGPTDTNLGLTTVIPGVDWAVLTASMSLPTGQSEHTTAESLVAGVIAAELLPFGISTWGSGGSAGGNLSLVRQLGSWGVGLSGGYSVANEYEPLAEQQLAYRPGDQLQVSLALDRDVGRAGTFSTFLAFQSFGNDQLGGADLFRSGNRIQALVSYAFAVGRRSSALLYGGVNYRENGTLITAGSSLGDASDAPSQQLFNAGTNIRVPLGRRAAILPSIEARVFRASDGASQGWVTSGGTTIEYRVAGGASGRRVVLGPTGQFRMGRVIVSEGVETSLMGWEAGLTLRAIVGR